MKNKIAVFPGSFDPFTKAHLILCRSALAVFDKVIILICVNPDKNKGMFTPEQRKQLIYAAVRDGDEGLVEVQIYNGLVTEYCLKNNINYIVRGIQYKNAAEEIDLSHIYYQDAEVRTIFFPSYILDYEHISSTRVREYLKYSNDMWRACVPILTRTLIEEFINKKHI